MKSDEDVQELKLWAREFASELRGSNDVLMYAPAGTHTITPAAGAGSMEITVDIDRDTAAVLNASLAAMNARLFPQKCFIDKEHEGKEATAWPEKFFWSETAPDGSEAPGVYLKCQMTALGRQLIEGKVFRAFSPSITTDTGLKNRDVKPGQHLIIKAGKRGSKENPARLMGVVPPDIGTLTNLPAFKDILPLFAKDASGGKATKPAAGAAARETGKTEMKKTEQELVTLRARKTELEKELPTLRAKDLTDNENVEAVNKSELELKAVNAELAQHDSEDENERLKTEVKNNREKEADIAIKAAMKRGAIPPKDLELQASWKKRCVEDPEVIKLLEKMPGAPALRDNGALQNRIIMRSDGAQEIRASTRDVLKAYLQHAEGGANQEMASLYAREIRPRLKEGDDLPMRAADVTDGSLGTLAGTLVAQRTLDLFKLQFNGILQMITTDFSDTASDFNGTTVTRIVVVPAVVSYDANLTNGEPNGWVQTTPAQTTDVPVTLDQHKGVPIILGSNILASTARRLFDEQAPAAAYALTKDMIDALYARVTRANYNDYAGNANLGGVNGYATIPEVDFGRRTFGVAGRIFNPAGVPTENRFALLNSDYHDALEQDPTLTNLAVYQQSQQGTITAGRLPQIKNFQPIEAPNLPATNNLAAFFGHKSSLLIKSRMPNDYTSILPAGAVHGLVRTVTDPDTGLSAMVVWFANHQRGSANFRICWMYGTAKGYTKGGLRVESQ